MQESSPTNMSSNCNISKSKDKIVDV